MRALKVLVLAKVDFSNGSSGSNFAGRDTLLSFGFRDYLEIALGLLQSSRSIFRGARRGSTQSRPLIDITGYSERNRFGATVGQILSRKAKI